MIASYASGKIINHDPLIVISKIHTPHQPLGLVSVAPEVFKSKPSIVFLSPSWWLGDVLEEIVEAMNDALIQMPLTHFVILVNDQDEAFLASRAGIDYCFGNSQIFINDELYHPDDSVLEQYDAVYHAIFTPFKNHELSRSINRLALIHQRYDAKPQEEDYVRQMLPKATIINEPNGVESYQQLNQAQVSRAINTAKVGLSLSSIDGANNEVMEYLLCGTPVVSVECKGGKNLMLTDAFAEIVEPDPGCVLLAVERMILRSPSRKDIRQMASSILSLERRNFLEGFHVRVEELFGNAYLEDNFSKLIDCFEWKSTEEWNILFNQSN